MWQGPTWSFAILLVVLSLREGSANLVPTALIVGFVLVMTSTSVALVARWQSMPVSVQALVPALDLVGAGLMVVSDPANASTTMLLCALPVVWLSFEFGWFGLGAGVVGAAATGITAASVGALPRAADLALVTLFVMGIGFVARFVSRVLAGVESDLVAQRIVADEARSLTEDRLVVMNGVMQSIDVAVMVWQVDGEVLLNDQARTMISRAGSTLTNLTAGGSFVFRDDGSSPLSTVDQAVPRAIAGEEFAGVMERVGQPGDQRAIVSSARRFDRPGRARGVAVLAAWDATDLMDAIKVREEFLATVSHELRTPLTAIIASMEVLTTMAADLVPTLAVPTTAEGALRDDSDRAGADMRRLMSAITRNAGLLQVRIEELLFSQPSTDQVLPVHTDVGSLIEAALCKHDSALALARVELTHVMESAQRHAEVDPARFEQVVDNVVSNAIKYTGPGGRITARLDIDDERVVFAVVDSGVGMTPDEQRQVFDRFYRAPRARAGAVQGLGIGLSLVKSIVERHQGHIDLRSAPDQGTTVTITLPSRVPTA